MGLNSNSRTSYMHYLRLIFLSKTQGTTYRIFFIRSWKAKGEINVQHGAFFPTCVSAWLPAPWQQLPDKSSLSQTSRVRSLRFITLPRTVKGIWVEQTVGAPSIRLFRLATGESIWLQRKWLSKTTLIALKLKLAWRHFELGRSRHRKKKSWRFVVVVVP